MRQTRKAKVAQSRRASKFQQRQSSQSKPIAIFLNNLDKRDEHQIKQLLGNQV